VAFADMLVSAGDMEALEWLTLIRARLMEDHTPKFDS
jgi:hypothetical protein